MVRLLHLADVHLDRAFGGQAFTGCDGARRRGLLRKALEWAVDLALERKPDAVTIGGDLFELEHVTSDTVAFILRQLDRLPCPVLVAPGNHDYASPASPYRTVQWPDRVKLALEPRLRPTEVGGAVIWSLGYIGNEIDPLVLAGFKVPAGDPRPQILLLHGVDLTTVNPDWRWGGLGLRPQEISDMGFDHALLGHIHAGNVGERMSSPGSPVPLDPSETAGVHGALWVEAEGRQGTVDAVAAGLCRFDTVSLDVTDTADSSDLENRLHQEVAATADSTALVTCRLWGRRRPGLPIDSETLAAGVQDVAMGVRVVDATAPEIDLTDLAREPNARGRAIAQLLSDGSAPALWAAHLVVEAFEGDVRLPV